MCSFPNLSLRFQKQLEGFSKFWVERRGQVVGDPDLGGPLRTPLLLPDTEQAWQTAPCCTQCPQRPYSKSGAGTREAQRRAEGGYAAESFVHVSVPGRGPRCRGNRLRGLGAVSNEETRIAVSSRAGLRHSALPPITSLGLDVMLKTVPRPQGSLANQTHSQECCGYKDAD